MNYTEELNKVMNNSVFTYRNCIVERMIDKDCFKIFGEIVYGEEGLNKKIKEQFSAIQKSIKT